MSRFRVSIVEIVTDAATIAMMDGATQINRLECTVDSISIPAVFAAINAKPRGRRKGKAKADDAAQGEL